MLNEFVNLVLEAQQMELTSKFTKMSFVSDNMMSILVYCLVILLYVLIKKRLNYFTSRGLPYVKPSFTDMLKSFSMNYSGDIMSNIYQTEKHKGHPYVGFFHTLLTPAIIVMDPDSVEKTLIKDFSHFQGHGFEMDPSEELLNQHLFNLRGDQWRILRHKLLPTFTSGKLKGMLPLIEHCSQVTIKEMMEDVSVREDVNLKELYGRYTLAVIATCVFGIDLESIKDPNCEFRRAAKEATTTPLSLKIKFFFIIAFPKLATLLGIKVFGQLEDFFKKLTKDALEQRKSSGDKRKDFVQLLLELKEKGSVQMDVRDLEEDEKVKVLQATTQSTPSVTKLEMSDELLTAQAFVFITAGFDNTAYLISATAYMFGKNQDVQRRVREEVRLAKLKHGGMNYLALKDMKLLEASIYEALRIHPPLVVLGRQCTKTYTMSNGSTIEKDVQLVIPLYDIQTDSQYWTDPKIFYPERWYDTNVRPGTYLPFGDGPRICIAQRMAFLMGKIMLADLLEKFELQPSSKTQEPIKIKVDMSPDVHGGFWGSHKLLKE